MAYFNDQAMQTPGLFGTSPVGPNIFNTNGLGSGYFDSQQGMAPGYETFNRNFAGGPQSKFYNWVQGRYNQNQNQYQADQAANPSLKFTDWLQSHQGSMQQDYANQNPMDRSGGFDSQNPRGLRWM